MGKEEITITIGEIEKSMARLDNISVRLGVCKNQKCLLEESNGEMAEQVNIMYNEVLSVITAMQQLVDQTKLLVEDGKKKFEETDVALAEMFQVRG